MTQVHRARAGAEWLSLREPVDAAARSTDLAALLPARLPQHRPVIVHDLGGGTGSMARWLAPQLPARQHWVLHDQDADLLALVPEAPVARDGGGSPVTVETRLSDITRLTGADLADADLITASALIDVLTGAELQQVVAAIADAQCPALLALTVTGEVTLEPSDPLDAQVAAAFNEHQRRGVGRGRLLGPDAAGAAASRMLRRGLQVVARRSPWRLGAHDDQVMREWLEGWLGAALEVEPQLGSRAASYTDRRLAQIASGELAVTVHHLDLLALPIGAG